jgi:hypothetical protein
MASQSKELLALPTGSVISGSLKENGVAILPIDKK